MTLRAAGIDIGSRTVKVVSLENGATRDIRIADAGFDPLAVYHCESAVK